jgi:uncharacterized YigZ family protein
MGFCVKGNLEIPSTYQTLKLRCEGMYKEKGSKFIGIAVACYSEDEAKVFMEEWKKEHHQARHLCYAYRFGMDKNVYRANDDGEPNNSAGAPILGQIDSFELTNVLIGVVRYYGGTKLGVGGLINAYRTASKQAIQNGKIIERELLEWVKLFFSYKDMPHVMNILKKYDLPINNSKFEVSCELKTALELNKAKAIKDELFQFDSIKLDSSGIY